MPPTPANSTINIQHLGMLLGQAETDQELFETIVNLPFDEYPVPVAMMFLGIIVLLLVDPETGKIDRVALSQTEMAKRTLEVSAKPFNEIKIDLNAPENLIAKAIKTNAAQETTDWHYLFTPALTREEAHINQANAGIAFSAIYPMQARHGGALIFSYYQYKSQIENNQQFMTNYSKLVSQRLDLK